MRIPMHRFKYTKLTPQQISARLKAAEAGPTSASAFSTVLNGKTLKIVTRDGPTLEYRFAANRRLTLTENGGNTGSPGPAEASALLPFAPFSAGVPGVWTGLPQPSPAHSNTRMLARIG